jgi:hypothetical protein
MDTDHLFIEVCDNGSTDAARIEDLDALIDQDLIRPEGGEPFKFLRLVSPTGTGLLGIALSSPGRDVLRSIAAG